MSNEELPADWAMDAAGRVYDLPIHSDMNRQQGADAEIALLGLVNRKLKDVRRAQAGSDPEDTRALIHQLRAEVRGDASHSYRPPTLEQIRTVGTK